jgi:hypothetical protein
MKASSITCMIGNFQFFFYFFLQLLNMFYSNLNYRWNLLDFITNTLYITTLVLKVLSYSIVQNEMNSGKETYKLNREKWDPWDPTLIRCCFVLV